MRRNCRFTGRCLSHVCTRMRQQTHSESSRQTQYAGEMAPDPPLPRGCTKPGYRPTRTECHSEQWDVKLGPGGFAGRRRSSRSRHQLLIVFATRHSRRTSHLDSTPGESRRRGAGPEGPSFKLTTANHSGSAAVGCSVMREISFTSRSRVSRSEVGGVMRRLSPAIAVSPRASSCCRWVGSRRATSLTVADM